MLLRDFLRRREMKQEGNLKMPRMENETWELQIPRKIGYFCSFKF